MKKGFTLIELLAVIIILAIVALIATPIVLDVVNDAKDSAAKSEASMIVSGVNNYCATAAMKEQLDGTTSICNDGVTPEEVKTMVDLGNAKINSITFDSKVTSLEVESNGRTVMYDGSEYTLGLAYYAFGTPTTSSSTNYQDVIISSGSNVLSKLKGKQISICIYRNNQLECFKNNNYEEESKHIKNVFQIENCEQKDTYVSCQDSSFYCEMNLAGSVGCRDYLSDFVCSTGGDGNIICS